MDLSIGEGRKKRIFQHRLFIIGQRSKPPIVICILDKWLSLIFPSQNVIFEQFMPLAVMPFLPILLYLQLCRLCHVVNFFPCFFLPQWKQNVLFQSKKFGLITNKYARNRKSQHPMRCYFFVRGELLSLVVRRGGGANAAFTGCLCGAVRQI